MIENLSPRRREPIKKPKNITYFKFFTFIVLLISLLLLGKFVEKNMKNQKAWGLETQKKESKPIASQIKDQTAKFADDLRKDTEKIISNVLGEATKVITNTASSSAEVVTDYVFKNTVGTLLKQIEKLPNKQKEEVKKEICK